MQYVRIVLQTIAGIGIICVVSYYIPVVILPMFYLYWKVGDYYRMSARELQRMETISRAGVAHAFNEAVTGVCTIRAFGAQSQWESRAYHVCDINHRYFFYLRMIAEWFSIRVIWMSTFIVFAFLMLIIFASGSLSASMAGLGVTTIIAVSSSLGMVVTTITEFDVNMTSVERLQKYSDLPSGK